MTDKKSQRKEVAYWAERPGLTQAFIKHTAKQTQRVTYDPDVQDADWIINHSGLGYLPLDIDIPLDIMRREAQAAVAAMCELEVSDPESSGWTSLGIFAEDPHGQGDHGRDELPPGDWVGMACEIMPETVRFFQDSWPCERFWRMRLLGLMPQGVLGLHKDNSPRGLHNINIALDHPPECQFFLEGAGVIPFVDGRVFATDVSRNHAVINPSTRLRLHIGMYQENDDRFRELLVRSYHRYLSSLA